MSQDRTSPPLGCREVSEVLPWLANNSLERPLRARVEHHLTSCPSCRAEAEACVALGEAVAAEEAPAPKPHPLELTRLLARIDHAEEWAEAGAEAEAEAGTLGRWYRRFLAGRVVQLWTGTPPPIRALLAAQLAGLVVLGGFLARASSPPAEPGPAAAGTYHTLATAPAPRLEERRLRVMFREDATEQALRALLLPLEARIVGGPTPLGAYTLALPVAPADGEAPASEALVLAHLRARAEVRFVEPLSPEVVP